MIKIITRVQGAIYRFIAGLKVDREYMECRADEEGHIMLN